MNLRDLFTGVYYEPVELSTFSSYKPCSLVELACQVASVIQKVQSGHGQHDDRCDGFEEKGYHPRGWGFLTYDTVAVGPELVVSRGSSRREKRTVFLVTAGIEERAQQERRGRVRRSVTHA